MPLACMRWMRRALLFPESKDEEHQATGVEIVDYIVSGREDGLLEEGHPFETWHGVRRTGTEGETCSQSVVGTVHRLILPFYIESKETGRHKGTPT